MQTKNVGNSSLDVIITSLAVRFPEDLGWSYDHLFPFLMHGELVRKCFKNYSTNEEFGHYWICDGKLDFDRMAEIGLIGKLLGKEDWLENHGKTDLAILHSRNL